MRVPTLGRRLYSALMFVLVSVLGGVLAAGLMVPAAGMVAEGGKSFATALNSLPQELVVGPPSEGSTVLMGDGKTVLTTFFDQNRKNVTLDQVAPYMRQAQVGIEDSRFYNHGALDFRGTMRALVRSSSGSAQGGSTLTQQYVKLALLYDAAARNDTAGVEAANNRTVSRKILELRYAIALEKQFTKDQILERYLNIAYYGDKAYGVEAASQHFFGVAAKDLSLSQAAMLAGVVRNPVTTNPVTNVAAATERMRNVLDRLKELKIITGDQATEAKKYQFDKTKVISTPARGCTTSKYPHLCDYVRQVLTKQTTSLGATNAARTDTLNRAGLTIQTFINPDFQDVAQAAVSNFIAPTDPVVGMMNMVQPNTGVILASAQSRPAMGTDTKTGQTFENYNAPTLLGGNGGSEGGSTFKAFTLLAAVMAGIDPIDHYIDSPKEMVFPVRTDFKGCSGANDSTAILTIPYKSTTAASANLNMYTGATASSNTFFMQLEQEVGVCNVVKAAQSLGLQRADGANLITGIRPDGKLISSISPGDYIDAEKPTFTVGNTFVSPISLANTYATLAARGKRCDTVIVKSIADKQGRPYAVPQANCQQVVPAEAADRVNDILHGPFSVKGTAEKAAINGYLLSGKTGTQTEAPTILINGYTPDIVGSVIITTDYRNQLAIDNKVRLGAKGRPPLVGLTVHGKNITIANGADSNDNYTVPSWPGYTLQGYSGTEAGGSIWRPAMLKVLPMVGRTEFVRPARSPYSGAKTTADITSILETGSVQNQGPVNADNQPIEATDAPSPSPSATP